MIKSAINRKKEETDLAFKRHAYAVQLFQNEVGRFWQRSLVFWGFIAAAFVAYGTFAGKDDSTSLGIACFGLASSVMWTLLNRASTFSQNYWVDRVDRLERAALGRRILKEGVPRVPPEKVGRWSGWRYSTTKLQIAFSDLTVIAWIALVVKSSIPLLQAALWDYALAILMVAGTIVYILLVIFFTRSEVPEETP